MTSIDFFYFSGYLSFAGSLIIAVFCLKKFRVRSKHIRVLACYAVVSVTITIIQKILEILFANAGVIVMGNTFVYFEAFLFSLIFLLTTETKSLRKIIATLFILYSLGYFIVFQFFGSSAYSLIRSGRDLLMILDSILFFYYLLRNLPENDLLKFPMFWISASVIFFFSGTFMLSFLIGYIQSFLRDSTPVFWTFRNLFRVAFCLVLAYAAWLDLQLVRTNK